MGAKLDLAGVLSLAGESSSGAQPALEPKGAG